MAYVYVFDIEGRVVHDGTEALQHYGVLLEDPETELALRSATSATMFDGALLHVSVPVVIGSQILGGVRIGISTEHIQLDIASGLDLLKSISDIGFKRLLLATLAITTLLAIVGVFSSVLLARNSTKPIRILSDLARRIGRGEFDVEVPFSRRDEVGDLARSFKEMAEELARETHRNALLATFVEHVGDAIEVINADGKIEYTNPAHERITGYSLAEAIGRTPAELHKPDNGDPALHEQIVGTTQSGLVWQGSMLGRKKDGTQWHQDATISPVRNEMGEITHQVAIKRDATADIQRQQALANSEQRFKDYAEASSDWLWETDENMRFVALTGNKTTIRGRTAEDAVGKTRWELFGAEPDEDENWRQHRADLEAHRPFRDFQYEYRQSDGQTYYLSASGKPTFDDDGHFKGYRGTARDMTAEVESEKALQESEQRFRDFAASSSDWLWEMDENLKFISYTGKESDIGRWRPDEALGKTRWESYGVDPDKDENWGRHKADLEARRPFRDFLYSISRRSDQTHYVSVSGKPIFLARTATSKGIEEPPAT